MSAKINRININPYLQSKILSLDSHEVGTVVPAKRTANRLFLLNRHSGGFPSGQAPLLLWQENAG